MTVSSVPLCTITLDDLNEVCHEVVALLVVKVDVAKGMTVGLPERAKPVVVHERPKPATTA
jgi:hypothetical protein